MPNDETTPVVAEPTASGFPIQVSYTLSKERVQNLLVSAFEGGSNYWYMIEASDYGPYTKADFKSGGKMHDPAWVGMDFYVLPVTPGCGLIISNATTETGDDIKRHRLDRESITAGLTRMYQQYPAEWSAFMNEDDDADTADVFLQCCLFGEVIYG